MSKILHGTSSKISHTQGSRVLDRLLYKSLDSLSCHRRDAIREGLMMVKRVRITPEECKMESSLLGHGRFNIENLI